MKYACVTGSTKGIGASIVNRLLEEGYFVFINYAHDDKNAHIYKEQLHKAGYKCFELIKADMSEYDSVFILRDEILKKTKKLDSLIINAAITDYADPFSITVDSWRRVIDTNLSIPYFLCRELYQYMKTNSSILFVGSVMGRYPHGLSLCYGASKAGVQFLAMELLKVFAQKKIRVNVVCPGFTNTPWQERKDPDHKKRIESKIALNRFAEPDEISDICWAVINNTYVNGSIIDVNGGYSFE